MINRFEWLKAVLQSDLPDRAKVLASVLAVQFGNDETGQINPGLDRLAQYTRSSEDTVRRGVADLEKAGWLARTLGQGRGNRSVYVLLAPGNVAVLRPAMKPVNRQNSATVQPAKRSQSCNLKGKIKGGSPAAKRSQTCKPLYKEEQSFEQKGQARPAPYCRAEIKAGSWHALEWNKWLSDRGLPSLASLKALHIEGGYSTPYRTPPRSYEDTQNRISLTVIEWAKSQSLQPPAPEFDSQTRPNGSFLDGGYTGERGSICQALQIKSMG